VFQTKIHANGEIRCCVSKLSSFILRRRENASVYLKEDDQERNVWFVDAIFDSSDMVQQLDDTSIESVYNLSWALYIKIITGVKSELK
jgi:hypothetical protein